MKMWEQTDSISKMTATCLYLAETHEFKVTVSFKEKTLSENFKASFEPRFGMDVLDANQSYALAEKLAVKLEKENV